MKPKIFLAVALVLLSNTLIYSQTQFEYGKPAELKDLTKVFISTGADLKSRDKFAEEIEKAKLSNLKIVDDMSEAEIIVTFEAGKVDEVIGTGGNVGTNSLDTGKGYIAIKGKDPQKPRILVSFENTRKFLAQKKPATKFAKEFIKAYKEANELK